MRMTQKNHSTFQISGSTSPQFENALSQERPLAQDEIVAGDMLVHHHKEAQQYNKDQLKKVKNLHELVSFKVQTVADRIAPGGNSDRNQPYTGQHMDALKKACDPLLSNYQNYDKKPPNYPAHMQKRAYLGGQRTVGADGSKMKGRVPKDRNQNPQGGNYYGSFQTRESTNFNSRGHSVQAQSTISALPQINTVGSMQAMNNDRAASVDNNRKYSQEEGPVAHLKAFVEKTHIPKGARKAPKDMNPIMKRYEQDMSKANRNRAMFQQSGTTQSSISNIMFSVEASQDTTEQSIMEANDYSQQLVSQNTSVQMQIVDQNTKLRQMQQDYKVQLQRLAKLQKESMFRTGQNSSLSGSRDDIMIEQQNFHDSSSREELAINAEKIRIATKKIFTEDDSMMDPYADVPNKFQPRNVSVGHRTNDNVYKDHKVQVKNRLQGNKTMQNQPVQNQTASTNVEDPSFQESISLVQQVDQRASELLMRNRNNEVGNQTITDKTKSTFSVLSKLASTKNNRQYIQYTKEQNEFGQIIKNQKPGNQKLEKLRQSRSKREQDKRTTRQMDQNSHQTNNTFSTRQGSLQMSQASKEGDYDGKTSLQQMIIVQRRETQNSPQPPVKTDYTEDLEIRGSPFRSSQHLLEGWKHAGLRNSQQNSASKESDLNLLLVSNQKSPSVSNTVILGQNINENSQQNSNRSKKSNKDINQVVPTSTQQEKLDDSYQEQLMVDGDSPNSVQKLAPTCQAMPTVSSQPQLQSNVTLVEAASTQSVSYIASTVGLNKSQNDFDNNLGKEKTSIPVQLLSKDYNSKSQLSLKSTNQDAQTTQQNDDTHRAILIKELALSPAQQMNFASINSSMLLGDELRKSQPSEMEKTGASFIQTAELSKRSNTNEPEESVPVSAEEMVDRIHPETRGLSDYYHMANQKKYGTDNTSVESSDTKLLSHDKLQISAKYIQSMEVDINNIKESSRINESLYMDGNRDEIAKEIDQITRSPVKFLGVTPKDKMARNVTRIKTEMDPSQHLKNQESNLKQNLNKSLSIPRTVQNSKSIVSTVKASMYNSGQKITIPKNQRNPHLTTKILTITQDGGYATQDELSKQDSAKSEMIEGIVTHWAESPQIPGWQAKRFRRYPRFSIYLQGDRQQNMDKQNYISMNQKVIQFLANQNVSDDDGQQQSQAQYNHDSTQFQEGNIIVIDGQDVRVPLDQSQQQLIQTNEDLNQIHQQSQEIEHLEQQKVMSDPFNKVLLSKGIDNALLTSFRTLSKKNNVISQTLKVVHNKFTPQIPNKKVTQLFKTKNSILYAVNEQPEEQQIQQEENEPEFDLQAPPQSMQLSQPSQPSLPQTQQTQQMLHTKNGEFDRPEVIIHKEYTQKMEMTGGLQSQESGDLVYLDQKQLYAQSSRGQLGITQYPDSNVIISDKLSPRFKPTNENFSVQSIENPAPVYMAINGQNVCDPSTQHTRKNAVTPANANTKRMTQIQEYNKQITSKRSSLQGKKLPTKYKVMTSHNNVSAFSSYGPDLQGYKNMSQTLELQAQSSEQSKLIHRSSNEKLDPHSYNQGYYEEQQESLLQNYDGPMLVQDKAVMAYILSIDPTFNNGVIKPVINLDEPEIIEKSEISRMLAAKDIVRQSYDMNISQGRNMQTNSEQTEHRPLTEISRIGPQSKAGNSVIRTPQSIILNKNAQLSTIEKEIKTIIDDAQLSSQDIRQSQIFIQNLNDYLDRTEPMQQTGFSGKRQISGTNRRNVTSPAVSVFQIPGETSLQTRHSAMSNRASIEDRISQSRSRSRGKFVLNSHQQQTEKIDQTPLLSSKQESLNKTDEKTDSQKEKPNKNINHFKRTSEQSPIIDHFDEASSAFASSKQGTQLKAIGLHSRSNTDGQGKVKEIRMEVNHREDTPTLNDTIISQNMLAKGNFGNSDVEQKTLSVQYTIDEKEEKEENVKAYHVTRTSIDMRQITVQTQPKTDFTPGKDTDVWDKVRYEDLNSTMKNQVNLNIDIPDQEKLGGQKRNVSNKFSSIQSIDEQAYDDDNMKGLVEPHIYNKYAKKASQTRQKQNFAELSNIALTEMQKIATRHISPKKQQHSVSTIIDKLYLQEKKHVYQKAYVREECFGKKDIIFELDRTHNTGQADIIKQGRLPDNGSTEDLHVKKNYKNPIHFLEGQKAEITKINIKPIDKRKARTKQYL